MKEPISNTDQDKLSKLKMPSLIKDSQRGSCEIAIQT